VLFEDATIQIGVKMECSAHQARLALYFGNKTAAPFTAFTTQLSPCPALAIQAAPCAATHNPKSQQQQMFNVECLGPFGDNGPQLAIRFAGGATPMPLVVRLPLAPSKFVQQLKVDGPEFFRRWKVLEGKEQQQIFKLAAVPIPDPTAEKVAAGLRMALLRGVDPNPANFVAAGWLAVKGSPPQSDGASVLMRLEVNASAGMCRASVRTSSPEATASIMQLVMSQLVAR